SELVSGGLYPQYPEQGGYSRYRVSPRSEKELPPQIKGQLKNLINPLGPIFNPKDHHDDNSNTQFATLALWVARRYALPVDQAVARLDARFRSSQNPDGGWGYRYVFQSPGAKGGKSGSTATMTCAGLLGLGVRYGAGTASLTTDPKAKKTGKPAKAPPDPMKDLSVRAGLIALNTAIDFPATAVLKKGKKKGPAVIRARSDRNYYFLWSVERVAVAYDLKTIGNKDWYAWGSDILVVNQEKDGSWQGKYSGGGADTCFALLFLRRANLAPDLTAALAGKVQDPGEVVLKSGGVGVEGLLKSGTPPKLEIGGDEKQDDPKTQP